MSATRISNLLFFVVLQLPLWPAATCAAPADLAVDQAALAAKFNRLEALALRIAELVESDDVQRAEQLRSAIRRSRELAVADRFTVIVELLETERLAAADRDQQVVADQLGELMRLLLADPREAKAEAERKRLQALLKEVGRFIKTQTRLRNELFDGQPEKRVADKQQQLADEVEQSGRRAAGKEGKQSSGDSEKNQSDKPSDGDSQSKPTPATPAENGAPAKSSPPTSEPQQQPDQPLDRARQRLEQARQAMQQAIEALGKQDSDKAKQDQSDAQQRLEDARREIEQALRQLREEEQIRRLTRLATRFRRMLAEQTDIYELTKTTAHSAPKPVDRSTRLAAAGLSQREQALVVLANAAMRLLQEDDRSIAFPETVEQLRGDMQQTAQWLSETRLGRATQQLEEDIIEQLQAAIDAFEKAAAQKQQQQQQPAGQPGGGPSAGPQLVDLIAELRMVRSLQSRLLRRTAMWDTLLREGEVPAKNAQQALEKLARDQQRLAEAAASLDKAVSNQ